MVQAVAAQLFLAEVASSMSCNSKTIGSTSAVGKSYPKSAVGISPFAGGGNNSLNAKVHIM